MSLRQINLYLPEELAEQIETAAAKRGQVLGELLPLFIKLGLLAVMIEAQQSAAIIIRNDDGTERELLLD